MSQYIGKTISLISNKGLRYVGLLDNINGDDATVALKSVRPFGSEGRMAAAGQPHMEVPPGSEVYDYVVFRGSDVKDLSVLDIPIDQVKPEPYVPQYLQVPQTAPTSAPPALLPQQRQQQPTSASYNAPTSTAPGAQKAPAATQTLSASPVTTASAGQGAPQGPTPTESVSESTSATPATSTTTKEAPTATQPQSPPQSQPGSVPHPQLLENRRPSKPANSRPRATPAAFAASDELFESDFDFESANARFSKEIQEEKEKQHQAAYNKSSSFFDSLSSGTGLHAPRWNDDDGSRNRGGYRGRGGRGGRGRGRGRGGFRNDYNSKPEWA